MTKLRGYLGAVGAIALLAVALGSSTAVSAGPLGETMFLQLQGIPGESLSDAYPNAIEVETFVWNVAGVNPAKFSNITIRKHVDRASPRLMLYAARGSVIPSGRLTAVKTGQNQLEYLVYCFTRMRVRSVRTTGNSVDSTTPHEDIALSFETIAERYVQQEPGGAPGDEFFGGWDVEADASIPATQC
jgi:type VI protein secretion system component Hcp